MTLKILENKFSICKVEELKNINFDNEFSFIGKTDEEISVVCDDKHIPNNFTDINNNWKCIKKEN